MSKEDAIRFKVLHLDGVAHEWWYHGLVSLRHDQITSYNEFMDALIKRFDRKDSKVYLRDLAQLKQSGGLESYISEFQRLPVMVYGILEWSANE